MEELDLISKFISRAGARIKDVRFFIESFVFIGAGTQELGTAVDGYTAQHQFFFGHFTIDDTVGGVINPALQNLHTFYFTTLLYNGIEVESARASMGVNCGMGLLGNGAYQGYKRLYAVGCNRVTVAQWGCGASTIVANISLNGYMFTIM
jgi:hypothetical protein